MRKSQSGERASRRDGRRAPLTPTTVHGGKPGVYANVDKVSLGDHPWRLEFPGRLLSRQMHGKPNCRLAYVRPFDSVSHMRGNFDVAAGAKVSWRALAFDPETGRPRNQKNPLCPILVIPKSGRARLTSRDDPFDFRTRRVGKYRDLLFARTRRQARKQIAASYHHGLQQ